MPPGGGFLLDVWSRETGYLFRRVPPMCVGPTQVCFCLVEVETPLLYGDIGCHGLCEVI